MKPVTHKPLLRHSIPRPYTDSFTSFSIQVLLLLIDTSLIFVMWYVYILTNSRAFFKRFYFTAEIRNIGHRVVVLSVIRQKSANLKRTGWSKSFLAKVPPTGKKKSPEQNCPYLIMLAGAMNGISGEFVFLRESNFWKFSHSQKI